MRLCHAQILTFLPFFSSVFLWDAWLFPFGFFQQLNFKTGTSYVGVWDAWKMVDGGC